MSEEKVKGIYKEHGKEFHLREYDTLRKEIELISQDAQNLQTYVLIGVGAVWTWLATNSDKGIPKYTWYVPAVFAILGGFKNFALLKGIKRISKYLQKIEEQFCTPDVLKGWETHVNSKEVRERFYEIYTWIFWLTLIVISLLVPLQIKPKP